LNPNMHYMIPLLLTIPIIFSLLNLTEASIYLWICIVEIQLIYLFIWGHFKSYSRPIRKVEDYATIVLCLTLALAIIAPLLLQYVEYRKLYVICLGVWLLCSSCLIIVSLAFLMFLIRIIRIYGLKLKYLGFSLTFTLLFTAIVVPLISPFKRIGFEYYIMAMVTLATLLIILFSLTMLRMTLPKGIAKEAFTRLLVVILTLILVILFYARIHILGLHEYIHHWIIGGSIALMISECFLTKTIIKYRYKGYMRK